MFESAVAKRMSLLQTESAFKMLARAKELEAAGRNIVHMEIGQPDFKTPPPIIEAAYRAMQNGYTGYSPTPGYAETREAIAGYVSRQKGRPTTRDEVIVVPGGKPIMFYTMLMLVGEGDEVVYPNPSFPIYESCIRFAGGVPVPIPLKAEDDFRMDIASLRGLLTPKTKLLILNNPSNPTGGVMQKEDILALAEILRDFPHVFILSDEIYDRLVFEGSVTSLSALPDFKDRVILLDGLSKTYAMTGWRLGYGVMHPELIAHMEMLMVNSNSCTASFTQMAAIEALTGPQGAVDEMREAFRERRNWLVGALNEIPGVSCRMPRGAFYVFPDISSFGLSSAEFAARLLDEGGVAALSGASFGKYGEGFLRFSYATDLTNIKIAVQRLHEFTRVVAKGQ
jgi:aspartate/methionine/tyrosine aminotransferase